MNNQEPLNTFPIQSFISQVKTADNSQAKEVKLNMTQAKNLAFCLTTVLCRLNEDLEKLLVSQTPKDSDEVIEVQINNKTGW